MREALGKISLECRAGCVDHLLLQTLDRRLVTEPTQNTRTPLTRGCERRTRITRQCKVKSAGPLESAPETVQYAAALALEGAMLHRLPEPPKRFDAKLEQRTVAQCAHVFAERNEVQIVLEGRAIGKQPAFGFEFVRFEPGSG